MAFPDDVAVHYRIQPGLPGASADAVRMTQIENDHATLLARPAITSLDAVPDVAITTPVAGQALMRNATNDGWVNGDPSGAISSVEDSGIEIVADAATLDFGVGLTVTSLGTGYAGVDVQYGGTGGSTSVSRSDHTHTLPSEVQGNIGASGALSSGSREVGVLNPVLASGVTYLVRAKLKMTLKGNGPGSSFHYLWLTIDGTAHQSELMQEVGGVPNERLFQRTKTITGAGTAITVQAAVAYDSGDPVDVRAGELIVELYPNK